MSWFSNIVKIITPKKPSKTDACNVLAKEVPMITKEQLLSIMPNCPVQKADEYVTALIKVMKEGQMNTVLRKSAFLGQIAHESNQLNSWIENLNYSAKSLMKTWPKRFPTVEAATPYVRNPERLANYVYSNRMGNGDINSGDGWRFRGRGPIQITGRKSYRAAGNYLKIDLENNPGLAIVTENGFRIAMWYWVTNNLNVLADNKDFVGITKAINGGTNGLAERQEFYRKALEVLK